MKTSEDAHPHHQQVVFCENYKCTLFCHIHQLSRHCCSLCNKSLVIFCQYCSRIDNNEGTEGTEAEVHDIEQYIQYLFNKRKCTRYCYCYSIEQRDEYDRVTVLLEGCKLLERLLLKTTITTTTTINSSITEYKLKCIRSRIHQLQTIQTELSTDKIATIKYNELLSVENMMNHSLIIDNTITIQDGENTTLFNKMLIPLSSSRVNTDWFHNYLKLETIYPKYAKYDQGAHVCIHATNCPKILSPEHVQIVLRGNNNIYIETKILHIQSNSFWCQIPPISTPETELLVVIEPKVDGIKVNNTSPPEFHFLQSNDKTITMLPVPMSSPDLNSLNQEIIFKYVIDGNLNAVRELVSQNPRLYLSNVDSMKRTILHVSCATQNTAITRYLLAAYAVYLNHLNIGKLEQVYLLRDKNGCTIETIADLYGHEPTIALLKQFKTPQQQQLEFQIQQQYNNNNNNNNNNNSNSNNKSVSIIECSIFEFECPDIGTITQEIYLLVEKNIPLLKRYTTFKVSIIAKSDYDTGDLEQRVTLCKMSSKQEAARSFLYYTVALWCLSNGMIPRRIHMQYVKQQLIADRTMDIPTILHELTNTSSTMSTTALTSPEIPEYNTLVTTVNQILKYSLLQDKYLV
jgi:hypothetical protein